MDMIYRPFNVFVESPLYALFPAVFFATAFARTFIRHRRRWTLNAMVQLFAALLWLGYTCLESYTSRAYPPETIPIRIDLLFIAPLLWIVSGSAVMSWLVCRTKPLPPRVCPG